MKTPNHDDDRRAALRSLLIPALEIALSADALSGILQEMDEQIDQFLLKNLYLNRGRDDKACLMSLFDERASPRELSLDKLVDSFLDCHCFRGGGLDPDEIDYLTGIVESFEENARKLRACLSQGDDA